VIHENDVEPRPLPRGHGSVRTLIDLQVGSEHVFQQVIRPSDQEDFLPSVAHAEQVLYVASGAISLTIDPERRTVDLVPGSAVFVPPTWPCNVRSPGGDGVILSVASPPPIPGTIHTLEIRIDPLRPAVIIHEDDQPAEPAGDDREFRLLIDPRHGARNLTQFVGFIDRSRAPFHSHTYDEAIYILEGEGIVHVAGDDGFDAPIRPGTSILLPPGTPHCLENASPGVLKLLGVFSPPGSPAMKRDG
jgi:mannose-6-phosphate isomerase-like protein (cupin superfamily)